MENQTQEPTSQTQAKQEQELNSNKSEDITKAYRTGLPKHGTRWARAQNPTPRELNLEERNAPQ
jgi:hypothetical protein